MPLPPHRAHVHVALFFWHNFLVIEQSFCDIVRCVFPQFLPIAVAKMRNTHSHCPKEVLSFIMDVIKFSDNQSNQVQ